MAGWDPSTIASVTALIVAVIAMFTAFAQALQQYFITGQLIRMCDSVVFGPLPGRGRRVWQFSQFRFRVLYSVPQISLRADMWPSDGGYHVKSYAIGRHPLPLLRDEDVVYETSTQMKRRHQVHLIERQEDDGAGGMRMYLEVVPASGPRFLSLAWWSDIFRFNLFSASWWKTVFERLRYSVLCGWCFFRRKLIYSSWWPSLLTSKRSRTRSSTASSARSDFQEAGNQHVGEASWVSFCRAIEMPCGESVRLDHVQYDADRCPSDLVSAPMQVSMRDVIIMALMAGMEITSASFDEKSVSMQGAVGTITSSRHAVLGPVLHFTPRNTNERPVYAFRYHLNNCRGFVDSYWLARTWGVCCVARRYFNWTARRTARRLDDRWIRDQDEDTWAPDDESENNEGSRYGGGDYSNYKRRRKGWAREIVIPESHDRYSRNKRGKKRQEDKLEGKEVVRAGRAVPEVLSQDGAWVISIPPRTPRVQVNLSGFNEEGHLNDAVELSSPPRNARKPDKSRPLSGFFPTPQQADAAPRDTTQPPTPRRRATVEDASDHGEDYDMSARVTEGAAMPKPQYVSVHSGSSVGDPSEALSSKGKQKSFPHSPRVNIRNISLANEKENNSRGKVVEENYQGSESIDVEDKTELLQRVQTAKALQAARAEKLFRVQRDKRLVEESVKRGVINSPYDEAVGRKSLLLLTNYAHNRDDEKAGGRDFQITVDEERENEDEGAGQPTNEEEQARERELKRAKERAERDQERDKRNRARNRASGLHHVDLYWMSQMDVMRGYWATPWHNPSITPIYSALTGCVTVVLEALLGFMGSEYIVYTGRNFATSYSFRHTVSWMCEEYSGEYVRGESSYNHTYPAYAHNARGGVIAEGKYVGCRIASFPSRVVPVLELAHSYDWQVSGESRDQTGVEEQNVELMRIDSWLSYVGRLDEISDGPHRLLRQTPALVHMLMQDFEIDFQNIDLSAKEGGLQDIQGLAANLMDFLTDEELTEAEQLYVLVALLRSVKVAQCVLAGSNTDPLDNILRKDVQAHLV